MNPDFLITGVGYDAGGTRIVRVEVRKLTNGKEGSPETWTRQQVVDKIKVEGKHFKTSTPDNKFGEDVRVVSIGWVDFLRTDANNIAADNLGSLPHI
jgi:hypothetical protein